MPLPVNTETELKQEAEVDEIQVSLGAGSVRSRGVAANGSNVFAAVAVGLVLKWEPGEHLLPHPAVEALDLLSLVPRNGAAAVRTSCLLGRIGGHLRAHAVAQVWPDHQRAHCQTLAAWGPDRNRF